MQESANPISTFLIDEATYQDLVKRANLADLLADRIIALEQQNKAILGRLDRAEFELSGKDGSIIASYDEALAKLNQRLAKLEKPDHEPGKTDTARVQKLIKYMKDRPDHKASFATLRGVLQVDAPKLRAVIKAVDKLDPGRFEVKDDPHDRRKSWLFAKR